MTDHDLQLHRLLRECAAELKAAAGPDARALALELLDEVDILSPGLIEQAAARALLRRLQTVTAH